MGAEIDVRLDDGRTLRAYDTGEGDFVVFWHHGTPGIGPPPPLPKVTAELGIRWIGYDRPGYGGSTPRPDRTVGSAATDAAAVADALGVARFAVMGQSGGGPHALACAALLPDRVSAVVAVASLSPYTGGGDDYFDGMADGAEATLRAAVAGRDARERLAAAPNDGADIGFLTADWIALDTDWAWFQGIVAAAAEAGPGPMVDDDLAYVRPWGFPLAAVTAPVLLVHGAADRMVPSVHTTRLAAHLPDAAVRIVPSEGHLTVMRHAASALRWLHTEATR